jgi:hypothetical protein
VARACPEVTIKLNGAVVGATGTKAVDPSVATEYRLTASLGASTKALGARVAPGEYPNVEAADPRQILWSPRIVE